MKRIAAAAVAGLMTVGLVACVDPGEACAAPGGGGSSSGRSSSSTSSGTRTAPRPAPAAPRNGSVYKAPVSKPTTYRTEYRDGRPVVVPIVVDDDIFEGDCGD
ncbi:hypothetical protein ACFWDN_21130 [Micromonospora chalcea]